MVTLVEFLDDEPIENVKTCLNYRVDNVIYFGYHDRILKYKNNLTNFLTRECSVGRVVFHELSRWSLPSMLKSIRTAIADEKAAGAHIYFDVTGGEDLILVAFGMVAREVDASLHVYDLSTGKLVELEEGASHYISKDVPTQDIKLDIDNYIKLTCGVVNHRLHKEIKNINDLDFSKDVDSLWEISTTYKTSWNVFSTFIRGNLKSVESDDLLVVSSENEVIRALSGSNLKNRLSAKRLMMIIDALAQRGLLVQVDHSDGRFTFRYKNELIKSCIWDSGSVLELNTYKQMVGDSDDCMVGVHLDWDGTIHPMAGQDVYNEIDVLAIKDGIPTFISCKAGHLNANTTLHALYELQTVTQRFGGRYAHKILATIDSIDGVYAKRAEEMGIELKSYS